jgi:hypothetical protein
MSKTNLGNDRLTLNDLRQWRANDVFGMIIKRLGLRDRNVKGALD